ncbi:hypothetical protein C491_06228 [Natronococcus amylolyticus DSM 10524]|uniref:DUF502 domain-containing protein n=1 Tax=Natronococcus amylolyticus DSM 10524 TaxID=1227497 RepID=L9XCD4_9EURY|nr:DUF502 domain-containing protein [Natronococcus amylolyticus]ELY59384.1 hypothetical protein C491_06228 [Natronococcus amylolyticus DSM 10524]
MVAVSERPKRWLVNGIILTIPLVVTLLVLLVVIDFVLGILSPIVAGVQYVWPNEPPRIVIQLTTLASLVGFFLVIGFAAEHTPGKRVSKQVHATVETIPGVSVLYESVRRASDILVDDETDQFKEVKLVEFPHDDAYMFGFLTADTPLEIEETVGDEEMMTIMVPLGPNPTTNGYVMHVSAEHVYDVDVTVEEAVRSIATLGVSVDELGTETADDADERAANDTPFGSTRG